MFAFLFPSPPEALGYLCATAGFLIIAASVAFVIKGKAVLGDSGAPNEVSWGKLKANLPSAVALFVLGALMIALPFWRFQEAEARQQFEELRQPAKAVISGRLGASGDVRLLLVVKPDYDQTYRGDIQWEVPLLATRTSYSVFYVQGATIVNQQAFTVEGATPGTPVQRIELPALNLQTEAVAAREIVPQLEVSDAQLQSLGIH